MTDTSKKQKQQRDKQKRRKDKGEDQITLGGGAATAAQKSAGPDSREGPGKDGADPRNLTRKEIKDEVQEIDKNIKNASLLPPKDAGPFKKLAYLLKMALLHMAGQADKEGQDAEEDENKSPGPDDTGDISAKKDEGKTGETENTDAATATADTDTGRGSATEAPGTAHEGKDLKKMMAEYKQAAARLQKKMEKMPKVAQLPTDPAKLTQAEIDQGVKDINTDINNARYLPPGPAGVFLRIAYLLREALLQMAGGGTTEGPTYKKLLEDYKEAYANIKDMLDNVTARELESQGMTREQVETELGEIKKTMEKIAKLPDTEAKAFLGDTINELQGMLRPDRVTGSETGTGSADATASPEGDTQDTEDGSKKGNEERVDNDDVTG
jgi:hypothetical protein